MNKETSKQRRKLSADSLIKTGKREEVELTEQQLSQASGGKHLAGVKYEISRSTAVKSENWKR